MKKYLLIIFFASLYIANAYEDLSFKPLLANPFEPRVGSLYQFDDEKLRLDIGHSVDLKRWQVDNNQQVTFGTDFFIMTRLRSQGKFKFPLETSDYFFGVNSCYSKDYEKIKFSARMRLAHISSHLVDGYSSNDIFWKSPYTYSREFVDLVGAININNIRTYLGLQYVFSTIPDDVAKIVLQAGFDCDIQLTDIIDFIAGYDFKLDGYSNELYGKNAIQAGILFNTSKSNENTINRGVLLSLYYYSGKSIHGLFLTDYDEYLALGFQVYFY